MQYAILILASVAVIAVLSWLILRGGSSDATGAGNPSKFKRQAREAKPDTPDQLKQKRNWIVGRSEDVDGQTFHMGQRTVTIGRKPTNFIQVGDSKVSRIHCQLRPAGPRAELVDMNSSSGTYLDGEKIQSNKPYRLENGSRFQIGDVEFEYRMSGDFEENYGVTTAKATGQKFETSTKLGGGAEWHDAIVKELNKANGNPQQAADNMGIELEVFMEMMQQADIDPENV